MTVHSLDDQFTPIRTVTLPHPVQAVIDVTRSDLFETLIDENGRDIRPNRLLSTHRQTPELIEALGPTIGIAVIHHVVILANSQKK